MAAYIIGGGVYLFFFIFGGYLTYVLNTKELYEESIYKKYNSLFLET
jgi:hypothetical protein